MTEQLKLDFNRNRSMRDAGKKTERITFTCSPEYKDFLDLFCKATGNTLSELCHRYMLDGMRNDLANIFITQPHLDTSLRDLLKKF
jgi:hypothetical protein